MKRIHIYLISFISILFLIFLLARPKQDIISVSLVSGTTETTYTDSGSIQIFEDAIRTAEKTRGSVDVGEPSYRITVTYADSEVVEYSLYMNLITKNGYLIRNSNSEKMLDLKDHYSEALADLISNNPAS